MTPLPQDPKVVVLVDSNGKPIATATNVAPDLEVVITQDQNAFAVAAKGQPFINQP